MLNRIGLDDVVHTNVMQSERWSVGTTYNYTHTQLYTDIQRYTDIYRYTYTQIYMAWLDSEVFGRWSTRQK